MFWITLDKYLEVKLLGPSLPLVIAFVLESILPGISIITPVFFFLLVSISMKYHLLSVCVLDLMSLLQTAYVWVLLLYLFSHLFHLHLE